MLEFYILEKFIPLGMSVLLGYKAWDFISIALLDSYIFGKNYSFMSIQYTAEMF
jgi:hypothetical protein